MTGKTHSKSYRALLLATAAWLGSAAAAQAADLGGDCCADLEERVAELEATAARKGNRKVSLQIYGQVSEAIIFWNDGAEKNAYVQENNYIKNKLGFQGNAKVNSDLSAGFRVELQIRAFRSSSANQLAFGENNGVSITSYNTQAISIRMAHWYLESNTYGRISVGRSFDSTVGTSTVNLASPDGFSGPLAGYINGGYLVRRAGTSGNTGLSALTWGNIGFIRNGDGPGSFDYSHTASQVKYTSPFFLGLSKSSGFRFEAGWGQDDFWSTSLRYVEDFGAIRFAAAAGYSDWRDVDRGECSNPGAGTAIGIAAGVGSVSNVKCQGYQASASAMHTLTGLYVSGGGGMIHDGQRQLALNAASTGLTGSATRSATAKDDSLWWVQAGWQAKLNQLGSTTFWGQYQVYNIGLGVANNVVQTVAGTDVLNSLGATAFLASSKTDVWGLGVSQNIDAAAMTLYAGFYNFSVDATLQAQSATAARQTAKTNPTDAMQVVYSGATIRF